MALVKNKEENSKEKIREKEKVKSSKSLIQETNKKKKNQTPSFKLCPKYTKTFGEIACCFVSAYNFIPELWQEEIIKDWLSLDKNIKFLSKRCGLSVPKQNSKSALLEIREIFGGIALKEKILDTAHKI
jgi:hypothetical protein